MRLSIITINYNNREGLEKTIRSVANQICQDFEYVIIDGASTDGSVDIIKENANIIHYWVSEKDNGIYHAMNKGVRASQGDYCLFLNSGDLLINDGVIGKILSYSFTSDIVSGSIKFTNGGIVKAPKIVTMKTFVLGSLPHQATLINRQLLLENPYDERFKVGGDWRFFLQTLVYKNASYERFPGIVSLFDTTGVSSTESRNSEWRLYEMEMCRDILPIRIEEDYEFSRFLAKWKWRFIKIYKKTTSFLN